MGATTIAFIGVDLKDHTHHYNLKRGKDARWNNLGMILRNFEDIARVFERENIKAYNLNEESLVRDFPFTTLPTLLRKEDRKRRMALEREVQVRGA
jgi:hypothetical protein